MTIQHKLLIGAYGWQHPQWLDSFYPEDLPEDWQLSYYSNEFRVLMIPRDYLNVDDKRNGQSLVDLVNEENTENCHYLFELPLRNGDTESEREYQSRVADLVQQMSTLQHACLGIVYQLLHSDIHNYEYLETLFQICTKVTALCVELPAELNEELSVEFIQLTSQYRVNACSIDAQPAAYMLTSGLHVTICSQVDLSARELRSVVENSLNSTESTSANVLIFRNSPPKIEQMQNAAIISDLL